MLVTLGYDIFFPQTPHFCENPVLIFFLRLPGTKIARLARPSPPLHYVRGGLLFWRHA